MLDGMGRGEMRAADGDRQAVADKLRAALDEGRLDLHEYDERLQQAYGAKTYGELDVLLTDLPATAPEPVVLDQHVTARWVREIWSGWGSTAAVLTAIWLISSTAGGGIDDYWPAWVIVPWGAVLVWQTVGGLATGEPHKRAAARQRKELAKQRKRERKALEAEAAAAEEA